MIHFESHRFIELRSNTLQLKGKRFYTIYYVYTIYSNIEIYIAQTDITNYNINNIMFCE